MRPLKRNFIAGLIVLAMTLAVQSDAHAQYGVVVQPVVPAVVGYTAERRGLFGQRVVMRPIVAPVAAAAPVVAARPVVSEPVAVQYAPPAAPVAAYYAPPAPVTMRYAPVVAPVATYYRAPVPVVPVRSYRVAVPYIYGF